MDSPVLRTIVDRHGVVWTFRVVTPARVERRSAERRQAAPAGMLFVPERRTGVERRVAPQLRVRLPAEYAHGWLMVEATTGQRFRVAPIPPAWEQLSETRLELLTRLAGSGPLVPDDAELRGVEGADGETTSGGAALS